MLTTDEAPAATDHKTEGAPAELLLTGHDVEVRTNEEGTRLLFLFGDSLIVWNSMSARVNGRELRATHDDTGAVRWVAPQCSKALDNGALALCHGTTHHITDMHDDAPFCTGLREH